MFELKFMLSEDTDEAFRLFSEYEPNVAETTGDSMEQSGQWLKPDQHNITRFTLEKEGAI